MQRGKITAQVGVGLLMTLTVVGCINLTGVPLPLSSTAPPPAETARAVPDLRIPAGPVAVNSSDIPVVPLPSLATPRQAVQPVNPAQMTAETVRPQPIAD